MLNVFPYIVMLSVLTRAFDFSLSFALTTSFKQAKTLTRTLLAAVGRVGLNHSDPPTAHFSTTLYKTTGSGLHKKALPTHPYYAYSLWQRNLQTLLARPKDSYFVKYQ